MRNLFLRCATYTCITKTFGNCISKKTISDTNLSVSVKCEAIGKQWAMAVEDCGYELPSVAVPSQVQNMWVAGNTV